MGLESSVTLFPADPAHRLVGHDLALFLDRVAERLIALGEGAEATVRAGKFSAKARTVKDLLEAIDAARAASKGKQDLEVRIVGDLRDAFSKYLGASSIQVAFHAFVMPQTLEAAKLCGSCGRPLDWDGYAGQTSCGCEEEVEARPDELRCCWLLRFQGEGPDGIGERFVEEDRRLEGSPFFESLEGAARTKLLEWHSWA
jgi:hypothetical protein